MFFPSESRTSTYCIDAILSASICFCVLLFGSVGARAQIGNITDATLRTEVDFRDINNTSGVFDQPTVVINTVTGSPVFTNSVQIADPNPFTTPSSNATISVQNSLGLPAEIVDFGFVGEGAFFTPKINITVNTSPLSLNGAPFPEEITAGAHLTYSLAVLYKGLGPAPATVPITALASETTYSTSQFIGDVDVIAASSTITVSCASEPSCGTATFNPDVGNAPETIMDMVPGATYQVSMSLEVSAISFLQPQTASGEVDPFFFVDPNVPDPQDYEFVFSPGVENQFASTTPLPAALPLFVSGVGLMGVLSWRRKRKPLAIAA